MKKLLGVALALTLVASACADTPTTTTTTTAPEAAELTDEQLRDLMAYCAEIRNPESRFSCAAILSIAETNGCTLREAYETVDWLLAGGIPKPGCVPDP